MAQHSELFHPEELSQSEPPGRYLGVDTSQKTLPTHTHTTTQRERESKDSMLSED